MTSEFDERDSMIPGNVVSSPRESAPGAPPPASPQAGPTASSALPTIEEAAQAANALRTEISRAVVGQRELSLIHI